MTLKQKKWVISLSTIAVAFVPIFFAIKSSLEYNGDAIILDEDEQHVEDVAKQIKQWNPGPQNVQASARISRFLPKHINDRIINHYVHEVIEHRKHESDAPNQAIITNHRIKIHHQSLLKEGTEINWKIGDKDDDKGQINMLLMIKKGKFLKDLTIEVGGFNNNHNKMKNDVIFAKNLIFRKLNMNPNDNLVKIPPPEKEYNFKRLVCNHSELKEKIPSEIVVDLKGNLTPEQFEILEIDPPGRTDKEDYSNFITHTADVHYRVTSHNDEEGKIIVTAFISKGIHSDTLDIPIFGFKTKISKDREDVQELIKSIDKIQTTTLKNFYPTWSLQEKVDSFKLGIKEIKLKGWKITYELLKIDEKQGVIKVIVKITKDEISENVEITINGYRTIWQYQVDETIKLIGDQITSKNNEVPKWNKNDIVNVDDLGIDKINSNQTTINYKIINVDQDSGKVSVEVTVKNEGAEGSKVITVSGFKKLWEVHKEIIARIKQNIKDVNLLSDSKWVNILCSEAKNTYKEHLLDDQLKEFNIQKIDAQITGEAKLSYQIIASNDVTGELTIDVTIEIGEIIDKVSFQVKGFQTESKHNQKLVDDNYKKILDKNNLTAEKNIINLVPNSNFSSKLPSRVRINVGDRLSANQLNNLNIKMIIDQEVKVIAHVKAINDKDSEMIVVITISKGEYTKTIEMIVKGFKSKSLQDKDDIEGFKLHLQDEYKDVQIKDNSIDKNALPSEVIKQLINKDALTTDDLKRLNIKIITDTKEATISYKVSNFSDGSGQIIITIDIKQNETTDSVIFQVKGFQTESERYQVEVDKAIQKFKKENLNTKIDKSSDLANKTPTEAGYKVEDILMGEKLNKLNLIVDENDFSIEWEFKVKAIDDKNGTITIEITAAKSFKNATTQITISGFKTLN